MKFLLYLLFFAFGISASTAQDKHFIFIQSENKLPFYVNLNGKIFSSTATGYLIIPKLTEGTYQFIVGFALNAYPEQKFQCTIENKDAGYTLKNFGEKGWGLFNLQSYAVTMGTKPLTSEGTVPKTEVKPDISFEKKKEEPKPAEKKIIVEKPVVAEIKKEEQGYKAEKEEKIKTEVKVQEKAEEPVATKPAVVPPKSEKEVPFSKEGEKVKPQINKTKGVIKIEERKTQEGVYLSFLDNQHNSSDTVELIVPNSKNQAIAAPVNPAPPAVEKKEIPVSPKPIDPPSKTPAETTNGNPKDEKVKFLEMEANRNKKVDSLENVKSQKAALKPNSACNEMATEDDYSKLRKKMAGQTGDDKMTAEAKKQFKNKCFSTHQVKMLSTLFLSDEARYKFFDEMYMLVSDPAEYPVLEKEFIDPYFANRFKAILRN